MIYYIITIFIFLNIVCDINYFLRTIFTMFRGLFQKKRTLHDSTTLYGIGTFQDCDINFKSVRLARLIREIDMARYHYYELTGIYRRSWELNISALQGCTLTQTMEPVPIFAPYKINTKLAYWDYQSLFLEHEVVTISDGKTRCFLVSRQHVIGKYEKIVEVLLKNLPGSEVKPKCPEYIENWLESMKISSAKLRLNM